MTGPPAFADSYTGTAATVTDFNTTEETGSPAGTDCVFSSGSGSSVTQTTPITSNGVTVTGNQTNSATVTDNNEPADTTNLSASVSGSAKATEVAGALKTFDMKATSSASVVPAQGAATDCESDAFAGWLVDGVVTLPNASIMVLEAKTRGISFAFGLAQGGIFEDPDDQTMFSFNFNNNSNERRIVAVPAGTYELTGQMGSNEDSPDVAGEATSSNGTGTAHVEFYAPGSALAPRAGSGKKFMKLPDALNCAAESVTADFTRKAGKKATAANGRDPKIRHAKFFVNGDKVKTKRKPHKNTEVTLANLDDTDEVAVRAVLKLWDKSKVEVTRNYLPCS